MKIVSIKKEINEDSYDNLNICILKDNKLMMFSWKVEFSKQS